MFSCERGHWQMVKDSAKLFVDGFAFIFSNRQQYFMPVNRSVCIKSLSEFAGGTVSLCGVVGGGALCFLWLKELDGRRSKTI